MVLIIRTSDAHWKELSRLLASCERCVEACARLDAHRPVGPGTGDDHEGVVVLALNASLDALQVQVDHELDRITAERLLADLTEKIRRAAGSAA